MNWYKKAQVEKNQTFYRIVCPALYGGQSENPIGVGTYWTPRWASIVGMVKTCVSGYFKHRPTSESDRKSWNVTIYKLDHAIWKDAPKEHSWAFYYPVDAGEQVLVKPLSEIQVVVNGFITDPQVAELLYEKFEPAINYAIDPTLQANWQGRKVHLYTNYKTRSIDIAEKNEGDNWSFQVVKNITSLQELNNFLRECQLPDNFDDNVALAYFASDMGWIKEQENELVQAI